MERERHGNESSILLSVPPAASIYHHWLCSQAKLMPTCCTQRASICIDVCVSGKRVECLCVLASLSFVFTQYDSWCCRLRLLMIILTGKEWCGQPSDTRIFFFLPGIALLRGFIWWGLVSSVKVRIKDAICNCRLLRWHAAPYIF